MMASPLDVQNACVSREIRIEDGCEILEARTPDRSRRERVAILVGSLPLCVGLLWIHGPQAGGAWVFWACLAFCLGMVVGEVVGTWRETCRRLVAYVVLRGIAEEDLLDLLGVTLSGIWMGGPALRSLLRRGLVVREVSSVRHGHLTAHAEVIVATAAGRERYFPGLVLREAGESAASEEA
jgi:hypothetical protein